MSGKENCFFNDQEKFNHSTTSDGKVFSNQNFLSVESASHHLGSKSIHHHHDDDDDDGDEGHGPRRKRSSISTLSSGINHHHHHHHLRQRRKHSGAGSQDGGQSIERRPSWLNYYGAAQQQSDNKNNTRNGSNKNAPPSGLPPGPKQYFFKPFTRESLAAIRIRIDEENLRKQQLSQAQQDGETIAQTNQDQSEPDPMLEAGLPLPRALQRQFPADLIATPIEDIDKYYHNKMTFTVISKSKDIFRFSATKSVFLLSPFNPLRRVAIYMLVHPLFNFLVIVTILVNCTLMTFPPEESVERTEIIFTTVYTFESSLKVAARGFILEPFSYLRDPWNWLDFAVITLAYLTMGAADLGNLSALRTFRVLRALKTVAIIPGMKTIVGAVIESVKNLKDVIILTCFALSIFSLLGLQIYMGVLTQKCVLNTSNNMTDEEWATWSSNSSNWFYKTSDSPPYLCGNNSQLCPPQYTCLQGFGENPNYGYTNFDTFGWALLSSFRLMTQDSWETLYQAILQVTGPWNIIFFLVIIFLGSFYLVNLILAIVAMSYDELQKKAEEEEEAAAAEEAAYAEACNLADEAAQNLRNRRESRIPSYSDNYSYSRQESASSNRCFLPPPPVDPSNSRHQLHQTADIVEHLPPPFQTQSTPVPSLSLPHSKSISSYKDSSTSSLSSGLAISDEKTTNDDQIMMANDDHFEFKKNENHCSSIIAQHHHPVSHHPTSLSFINSLCKSHCSLNSNITASSMSHKTSLSLPVSPSNLGKPKTRSSQSINNAFSRSSWTRPSSSCLSCDARKPLVSVRSYIDAQRNLPFADDSAAGSPMSEKNSLMMINNNSATAAPQPYPTKTLSLSNFEFQNQQPYRSLSGAFLPNHHHNQNQNNNNSSLYNSTYTSHSSRISYTSHGDIYGQMGFTTNMTRSAYWLRESQMRSRRRSNIDFFQNDWLTTGSNGVNQFLPIQQQPSFYQHSTAPNTVKMKDVMVLNDIIEQAAHDETRRPNEKERSHFVTKATYAGHHDYEAGQRSNSLSGESSPSSSSSSSSSFYESESSYPRRTLKERFMAGCVKCLDIMCVWDCCWCWVRVQELVALIVFDPFMELFITLCIVVNTLFMAMDHHNMDKDFEMILQTGNYFFTATFAIESTMKLVALSPKFYFREGWNIFDFIIVILSLLDVGFSTVSGLSVLRSFRLLRVFKLAKSWPTLNLLISIMGKTVGDLGNLTFVLAIIIFIFAVMGMQLFGKNYTEANFGGKEIPRWNFRDFMHSFMIVFRVLCGEWIESMWDCMRVSGAPCVPFFLATVVIGNLVVLSLFLALLLSSFGASNLSAPTSESTDTKKLQEAFDRFARLGKWMKRKLINFFKSFRSKARNQIRDQSLEPSARERTMLTDSNMMTDQHQEMILIDGQLMANKPFFNKTLMSDTELEMALINTSKMNGGSGTIVSNNNINQSIPNNLFNVNSAQIVNQPVPKIPSNNNQPNQLTMMMSLNENELNNNNNNNNNNLRDERDMVPNRTLSQNSLQKPQSLPNVDDTAQQFMTAELVGDVNDENALTLAIPSHMNGAINTSSTSDDKLDTVTADVIISEYPVDCFPQRMYDYCPCCLRETPFWIKWKAIRLKCYKFVEHKYFETLVITLILISSMTLALEDVNFKKDKVFMEYLGYMDKFFTVIFLFEMLIKWLAFGFADYFTNAWCWLDFVIVMVSLLNFVVGIVGLAKIPAFKTMRTLRALRPLRAMSRLEGMRVSVMNLIATWFGVAKIQAFKTMRTLRALRPLRALSRFQGMRLVVNALVQAIPAIFNVLLVCLIFWLIFSIMGVQLFMGKFYQCIDAETKLKLNASFVPNKEACKARNNTIWYNPQVNFDNVPNAYLALFQVATFKGWIPIMNNAIDSKQEPNQQPEKEVNVYMYFYFVSFIIVGSFFTLNLFIGVIIDNFNEQKKKAGGSLEMFMTEDQKKYYNAMKKMGSKKPMKAIPRPRFRLQAIIFDVITNKKFDMIIMLFIAFNMLIMSLDQYKQSAMQALVLERLNLFFIVIFTAECSLKIFALRWHYFKEPWNIFDFVVVTFSILGVVLRDIVAKYILSPTLLRVVRVVKIGRVLRLVKGARGIRTLLFALAMSLPALFNICLLLFMVIFIYAIFGMSFFMNVKQRYGIDETFNFSTFFKSFILLFQMSTSAGWDSVLAAIMDENDCTPTGSDVEGDCGNRGIAITFLISYLIISFLIIINMYIAVILENYSQATEDVHEGLTDDDYDMYYEIWQKFDPKGTQFIPYEKLSEFVNTLEEPLQIPKPNTFKLISMDIPICVGDMCYCVDILDALTKDFFARKGHVIEETAELAEVAPIKLGQFEHISSTLWRQREIYCARIIQTYWREYLKSKRQETLKERLETIEEHSNEDSDKH